MTSQEDKKIVKATQKWLNPIQILCLDFQKAVQT